MEDVPILRFYLVGSQLDVSSEDAAAGVGTVTLRCRAKDLKAWDQVLVRLREGIDIGTVKDFAVESLDVLKDVHQRRFEELERSLREAEYKRRLAENTRDAAINQVKALEELIYELEQQAMDRDLGT